MSERAFASRPVCRLAWVNRKPAHPLEAWLGNLVQLPKRGRNARPAVHEPAEVILFTGVRYERNDTPAGGMSPLPNKPAGAASGKRRRG